MSKAAHDMHLGYRDLVAVVLHRLDLQHLMEITQQDRDAPDLSEYVKADTPATLPVLRHFMGLKFPAEHGYPSVEFTYATGPNRIVTETISPHLGIGVTFEPQLPEEFWAHFRAALIILERYAAEHGDR